MKIYRLNGLKAHFADTVPDYTDSTIYLVTRSSDYKLVNDYISQTFGIMDKRNQVSFTLRDVFVMEHTDYNDYELMFGKDINTQYQITIQRDPCVGKDEQLKGAQDAEKSIATA